MHFAAPLARKQGAVDESEAIAGGDGAVGVRENGCT